MNAVARLRDEIYDYFQASSACQAHFFDLGREAQYVQYYNSMYLLQDSTESLLHHRDRGFSSDSLVAYLELWGVMQAVIIQQDAACELYEVLVGKRLKAKDQGFQSWLAIRELRNTCAGHPANSKHSKVRSFMGRAFGGYNALTYERWEVGAGTTHPEVALGAMLDAYAIEVGEQLKVALAEMKRRWP